jgi:GNAT superfamily N-acetyltransferase
MELVRLVIDGFPHMDEAEHEQNLRRYIEKRGALITKEDGKIIGAMMLGYKTGSIDFLGVHPLYRKQGLNRLFLDKALGELLRHRNISITTFRAGDRADTGQRQGLKELGFAEAELLMEFGYPTQRMILPNQGGDASE